MADLGKLSGLERSMINRANLDIMRCRMCLFGSGTASKRDRDLSDLSGFSNLTGQSETSLFIWVQMTNNSSALDNFEQTTSVSVAVQFNLLLPVDDA